MNKNNKYIILLIVILLGVTIFGSMFNNKYEVKAISNNNDIYDVVLFWGQSNMVGGVGCKSRRSTSTLMGEDAKDQRLVEYGIDEFSRITSIDKEIVENYETLSHVNIDFSPNTVYEYKYSTNKIYPLTNSTLSIGESLNVSLVDDKPTFIKTSTGYVSSNKSCGTNLTEYFGKVYYEKTGHKVVIVHVANGGEQIAHFLPHDRVLVESLQDDEVHKNQYIYEAMVEKYNAAIKYLNKHSMTIGNKFYVSMQGETDAKYADNGLLSSEKFEQLYMEIHNDLKKELGLQFGVIIETSRDLGSCMLNGVNKIHLAQEKMISDNNDIILGSTYPYDSYVPCENEYNGSNYNEAYNNALLRVSVSEVANNTMHFNSAALSQIGKESATNAIKKVKIKVTFHKNDGTSSSASQEFITDDNNRFAYKTDGTVRWKQTGQFGGWNRKGYKLLGWNIDPNAKTAIWSIYSKVSDNWINEYGPSIDLYAIWQKETIKVTFHKNDGTTSSASQEFTSDDNNRFGYKTDGTVRWKQTGQFGGWNRKGYKLLGWNIDPNAKTAIWSIYSKVSNEWIDKYGPSIDLYAIWQKE